MVYSKLIDDYILGKLPKGSLEQFEKELKVNLDLQREVNLCLELKDSIINADEQSLRAKLNIAHSGLYRNRFRVSRLASLIAVASIALMFGVYSLFFTTASNPQKIFAAYYKPFQVTGETRAANGELTVAISTDLVRLYANNEYDNVIPVLESVLKRYPSESKAILMLSSAYIQSNRAEMAEKLLKNSLNVKDDLLFSETKKWYLALVILKQNRPDDARTVLQQIYNEKGLYAARAKEIIDLL